MSIKNKLSPRDRVMAAVHRSRPDRVPFFYRDVPEVRRRLLGELNLHNDEELFAYLEIDFRWVEPAYIGPELNTETGRQRDMWGTEFRYVPFSDTGGYWETHVHPLAEVTDPEQLDKHPWPELEWFDFESLPAQVEGYRDYAVMTAPGEASPSVLQFIQRLAGLERSWTLMAAEPELFDAFVEKILAFVIPFIDRMLAASGGGIDFLRIGDDFGSQNGMLFSPRMWRERLMPAYRRIAEVVKSHNAFYYHHSCGGIREIIPDLIDIGVDVLDPVQVRAAGMEPEGLKRDFGGQIVFSGGVDEQELLPNGPPERIRRDVQNLLDVMAGDGGFFIGPTHNFQDDIPTRHILAMYEAAGEWNA